MQTVPAATVRSVAPRLAALLAILALGACRESDSNSIQDSTAPPGSPTTLTYDETAPVYVVGVPIVPNAPSVDVTQVDFEVTPSLPVGLVLNPDTGVISGTPTVVTPAEDYLVTASNSLGAVTETLTIEVAPSAPLALVYGDTEAVYVAGRAIEPNAPAGAGAFERFTVRPPLPDGLVLDATDGTVRGTPARAAVATTHAVTASGPAGAARAELEIAVAPWPLTLEPGQHGGAAEVRLVDARWGRLVDVWGLDPTTGEPRRERTDAVVDPSAGLDGGPYALERNPVTQVARLVIAHPIGSAEFEATLVALDEGLEEIRTVGTGLELPTAVARNGALVLRFDDLLDDATIGATSVELCVGYPPATTFLARVVGDRHHGGLVDTDGDGEPEVHTSRVVVDLTVSEVEALAHDEPLPLNLVGLPEAREIGQANVELRLPTQTAGLVGPARLANLRGNGLSATGNGAIDPTTGDVLRGFRSGGGPPGDPASGFLGDTVPPRVLGVQTVDVTGFTPAPAAGVVDYAFDLAFHRPFCAQTPERGDVVQRGGVFLEVVQVGGAPAGGIVTGVQARVVAGDPATLAPGIGGFFSVWDPLADAGTQSCFVRFLPTPSSFPPVDVSTTARITVRFTEPMDLATISPLDDLTVSRVPNPIALTDRVVGEVIGNAGPEVAWIPLLPFAHEPGVSEGYFVDLVAGGPTDLAGNPLVEAIPQVKFDLDPARPRESNGGVVLRFTGPDEDGDALPELRGQVLYDLLSGEIAPRPMVRSSLVADRTQPVPSAMVAFPPGTPTPLSPLGSKLQQLWRYHDVGLALLDEATHNVDVEGLAWSPVGGQVVADQYAQYEMRLSHGRFLPDEALNPQTLFPKHPLSGVTTTYADNALDDPQVVHEKTRGYSVSPADRFTSSTGTPMMPFPLNRGLPVSEHRTYTWRDTAIGALGGPNGAGADTDILAVVLGGGVTPGVPYAPGEVPTIGLPLLVEHRCYPDAGAVGLNAFDVSLAINSSARPNFRAFSAGGVNASGGVVTVDPDASPVATGGFDPSSAPPGQPTLPVDNLFYLGQIDVVTRVSRSHTRWIDTGVVDPRYFDPVLHPRPHEQPAGTEVVIAWRGASAVTGPPATDASSLDPYGDPWAGGAVTFPGGDASWTHDVTDLDGRRWVQARITFVGDLATLATARLSGLGLAWRIP